MRIPRDLILQDLIPQDLILQDLILQDLAQHPTEHRSGIAELMVVESRIAKHESLSRLGRDVVSAHRPHDDAVLACGLGNDCVGDLDTEVNDQLDAAVGHLDVDEIAHVARDRRDNHIARLAIARAHPADMTGEEALPHELGRHRLLQ